MSDLVQARPPPHHHREFPGVEIIFIFRSGQANTTGSSPANNNTDLEQQQTCGPHETGTDFKSCCGISVSQTVSIRWFIVMIAFVGICCAVVGTVLGAMKASGREHLTVSLLMIGQYHASNEQSGRISVRVLTVASSFFSSVTTIML